MWQLWFLWWWSGRPFHCTPGLTVTTLELPFSRRTCYTQIINSKSHFLQPRAASPPVPIWWDPLSLLLLSLARECAVGWCPAQFCQAKNCNVSPQKEGRREEGRGGGERQVSMAACTPWYHVYNLSTEEAEEITNLRLPGLHYEFRAGSK